MYKSLALLALLPTTFAHFLLNYPATIGFDDNAQSEGPCGGPDITNRTTTTNVTVGDFAVALRSTHPQSEWLFRYTLSTEEPYEWTNILPVISQSGIGNFCIPALTVQSDLAGRQAIIQIVGDAVDGALYQCAAVNFVEGTSPTPAVCVNGTGVTATLTTQTALSNDTSSSNASSTGSATTSATAAASSGAAVQQIVGGLLAMVPVGMLLL